MQLVRHTGFVLFVGYSVCYLIIHPNSREDLTMLHIRVVTTYNSAANFLTPLSGSAGSCHHAAGEGCARYRQRDKKGDNKNRGWRKRKIKKDIKVESLEI
jgi:hypothetical protein